mmetsp:Transcript_57890/g.95051  ORF Transcript_57890/g.95051 Transcript_57890/m.95051 type:complete len:93 (-) Transcript_57890:208-486(-)
MLEHWPGTERAAAGVHRITGSGARSPPECPISNNVGSADPSSPHIARPVSACGSFSTGGDSHWPSVKMAMDQFAHALQPPFFVPPPPFSKLP